MTAVTLPLPGARQAIPGRWRPAVSGAITGAALGGVLALCTTRTPHGLSVHVSLYGAAVMTLISVKMLLSLLAAPPRDTPAVRAATRGLTVAAVITVYNEDPAAFSRCLDSFLAQTRLPDAIAIIDDCSASRACYDLARARAGEFEARDCAVAVIRQPRNLGKREGLAAGFTTWRNASVYLCVDSDTILDRYAIARALPAFADLRVMAATGTVLAANRTRNLLTRLIDLRYTYAFLGERAAYSVLGAVLCVCGSLAFYRGSIVREHLDDFTGQTFLGQRCTYGDDRHLTNLCLRHGRVVLVPGVTAWTYVPERLGHFLRQQLRWSKSFARETLWALRHQSPARPAWWLTLLEAATQAGFTAGLLYSLAIHPLVAGRATPGFYLLAALLLAYARAGHYAEATHPDMTPAGQLAGFALAPLYSVLSITLLLPLRLYALCTLRDASWGTRQAVEVEASPC